MKRRVISMLAALTLLATASAPCALVYAEGDVELTVSTEGTLQNKGDGENGDLDSILDANASVMGALGSTTWTVRAESVQKTGKWRDDLIAVAQSQVGYAQSADGTSLYGEWLGEPSAAWDAAFVSWVADQAGLTEKQFPHAATYDEMVEKLTKWNAVKKITRANYPNPGDIALLSVGGESRMGIVAYVSGGYAAVICGNDAGAVTRATYQIEGNAFKSYVDLNVLMSRAGLDVSKGDEVTIPAGGVAAWTNTDSVYMRKEPTTKSKKVTMVKKSGTALLVTSAEKQEDGYVWYGVTYKEYKGYIRGDLIQLDTIEASAPTAAPETAPACVICGANGAQDACLYSVLAAKSADEAFAFLQNLLENDRAAFDLYVKCHSAHVSAGAPAVICGNGCTQTLTNLTAPGASHSDSCPWHAEAQLGVEERVVNIAIVEAAAGQTVDITFDVYGATAYQWYVKKETATDTTEKPISNATKEVLTVVARSTDKTTYSYYCIATLEGGSTVTSKITRVDVADAPVVAEAILGEEVKFTYTNNSATSFKWFTYDAATGAYTAIDTADLTYIGAETAMLAFYATEDKAEKVYVCKAYDADGSEMKISGQYQLTIQKTDLCKYVEELANMTPDERDAALNVTWNIILNGENLADAVKAHWSSCENKHNETYPSLFDDNAANNGNVREKDTTGSAGLDVFTKCENLPTECALIQHWIDTQAAPMTIYTEMNALRAAPGYTADSKKYDRYFALCMHLGEHDEALSLICNCGKVDGKNLVIPGPAHDETCPWHSAYKAGLNECTDENGETYYVLALAGADGTVSEVAKAVKHPKDPDHYYLKDDKTGLYVAYLDENGNIVPLKSDYESAD